MVGLALARMRLRIGLIAAIRTIVGFRFVIEAQAFGGVDMHYDRVVNVFDLVQYFHQRVNVITLLHIAVVQAECLEQIQFGHAIRRTQLGKLPVHTAEILSDRHFVVVDDDDEITALFGRIVQPLERNGRTQGSIADNGDNIADSAFAGGAALHIAGFGKTAGREIEVPVWPSTKESCSLSSGFVKPVTSSKRDWSKYASARPVSILCT